MESRDQPSLSRPLAGGEAAAVAGLVYHATVHQNDGQVRGVWRFRRDWQVDKKVEVDFYPPPNKGGRVIGEFSDRSRYRLLHFAKNCNCDFHSMLTLTYPSDFPCDGKLTKRHLDRILKRLAYLGFKGIWFLEFQMRGAPHYHILLDADLASFGDLVAIRRTHVNKHASDSFLTEPRSQADMAKKWYRIVRSGDEKHLKAGVCWEQLESSDAAVRYAAKHAAKVNQKRVPKGYLNVGRFWGHFGGVTMDEPEFFACSSADLVEYVGPDVLSRKGRIKKYIWDAEQLPGPHYRL